MDGVTPGLSNGWPEKLATLLLSWSTAPWTLGKSLTALTLDVSAPSVLSLEVSGGVGEAGQLPSSLMSLTRQTVEDPHTETCG